MTNEGEFKIVEVAPNERAELESLLEESFTGLYLWHSKKTLKDIEYVKSALINSERAGVVMLKYLDTKLGYVYYIAVARKFRGTGVAGKLLDDSLELFFKHGVQEVYASIKEDNSQSLRL